MLAIVAGISLLLPILYPISAMVELGSVALGVILLVTAGTWENHLDGNPCYMSVSISIGVVITYIMVLLVS
jgi:hypothetical protein